MGLAMLQGISPWWWVALAVLLAAGEMLTVSTVLLWSALAAMIVAILLWVVPDMSGALQIGIFSILSILLTFGGRAIFARVGEGIEERNQLNQRSAQLVGREARVIRFDFHEGTVEVDGVPWPARLDGPRRKVAAGEIVQITAADGVVLWVRPVEGKEL
jgi:membrane protein implicated in regulation of membrane protease activity